MADLNPLLALDAPSVTHADRRGGRVLTYRGYRYSRSNSSHTRIYWRCARRNCGETVITNRFNINHTNPEIHIQQQPLGEHTHAPDDEQIRRRQFVDEAAALVRNDPSHTIRRAYNIILDRGHHHPPNIPTFQEIKSQLQRVRLEIVKRDRIIMPRKKLKTGGPSGDDPATSVTTPPPPAASGLPTTPPPTTLPSSATTRSNGDESIAEKFISLMEDMVRELDKLKFGDPVSYIYNPLVYAKETHDCFIRKYGNSTKSVLFLGMNPGPFGMAQNGVPFGETNYVKDWMKITGNVGKPPKEHPKRTIVGLNCNRSEVSGQRFWKLWQDLCGTPENFFKECFVYNHCPLVFMTSTSKNVTPPSMKVEMRNPLNDVCDDYLCRLIQLLEVKVVVGIGKFAEARTKKALEKGGVEGVRVVSMMHPSPINPAANKGWQNIAEKTLEDLDLMKYMSK